MNNKERILYHGSDRIITNPIYGGGRDGNDYGNGFYCTENEDLAREWACLDRNGGFVNRYLINETGLKIVDLSMQDYNALNWLAILLDNRKLRISSAVEESGKQFIINNYLPDTVDADIVIGYRADDSFFSFARAFLSNTISYQQLCQVLRYGDLGLQYVLISEKSYENIRYIDSTPADGATYYFLRKRRDVKAREDYRNLIKSIDRDGLFLNQIIREEITDERLQ